MATGLIGGLAFCLVVAFCVGRCFRCLRHDPRLSWVALLFLQTLLGGLFSGALYSAPAFWSLLGIVLAVKPSQEEQEEQEEQQAEEQEEEPDAEQSA